MAWNKYQKLVKRNLDTMFADVNTIVVQEKLDGANASFYIEPDGKLHAHSRNRKLSETETLRGFYGHITEKWIRASAWQEPTEWENYTFYGEWLVPHTLEYKDEAYNQFYLFDVYDNKQGMFLDHYLVRAFARILDVPTPDVLFIGSYSEFKTRYEELTNVPSQLSKSGMMEGIVLKPTHQVFYKEGMAAKIVNPKFQEVKGDLKVKEQKSQSLERQLSNLLVTDYRVEKTLHKLIDEGTIDEEITPDQFGKLIPEITAAIVADVIHEDLATNNQFAREISKRVGSTLRKKVG